MKDLPVRKPNRLPYYDYSENGAYFVTICAKDFKCLFGKVKTDEKDVVVELSAVGETVKRFAEKIDGIEIFQIMPNHIHMIIGEYGDNGRDLSQKVRMFKASVTIEVGRPVWQRSYYDHLIRDGKDYDRIVDYIVCNPGKWFEDKLHRQE